MNTTVSAGPRSGCVRAPASKSQAHRLLICAALGRRPVTLSIGSALCDDLLATIRCLSALGAGFNRPEPDLLTVFPITRPAEKAELFCGESGTTLRLLLPVVGALGTSAVFLREGRLPERPLAPLDALLTGHGMDLHTEGSSLVCRGRLRPGDYCLPGNVSSQYVSGLLLALPLLNGSSTLRVSGPLQSAGYVAMTEDVLAQASTALPREDQSWRIAGSEVYSLPSRCRVEGDWSGAAFFLCAGAFSRQGIRVSGLNPQSRQGDRAAAEILAAFGARVQTDAQGLTISRGPSLQGLTIDAGPIPDLIPALSVVAAAARGTTRIENAARLRLKESDRLQTTASLLQSLGVQTGQTDDSLIIHGTGSLHGGSVNSFRDHRIAMAAAAAACAASGDVLVLNSDCTAKSYPGFWDDFHSLKEEQP